MIGIDVTREPTSALLVRNATVKAHVPSLKKIFIVVSWIWFREYISSVIGIIHDCYITAHITQKKEVRLLGTTDVSNEIDDMRVSTHMEKHS